MSELTLFCNLGLIGTELKIEKDVLLTILDGRIRDIEVGSSKKEGELQYDGCAVIPGFINAHTHIGDSFAKDQGLELSLKELVAPPNGLKHRLLDRVSDEDLRAGLKWAIAEMISSGITTFVDFREDGERGISLIKEVLKNSQINGIICGRSFPSLQSLSNVINLCDAIGLSSCNIYSDSELEYIRRISKDHKKLILTHVAESQKNQADARDKFRISDIKRAIELLDADILIHATWADELDVQLIVEKGKPIVICPRSNFHLGVGFPPVDLLLKYDVLTCLGTDNVMVNNLNLFREMEFLFKFTRGKFGIGSISSLDILKMVTINPAKALNLEKQIGSISVGNRADFFLIDLNAPNLNPFTSFYDALVFRANPNNIILVYSGGKLAYERESGINK